MSRMRIIIGVLLLLGSVLASAACTANTLPAPVVLSPQNTAVPLQLATGTNSGDAFYIPAGQTNNVISKYTRNTGVTTTLTGQFGPSTTMVDGSSANARIVSLSALTYCDTAGMVYFIDSGTTLRKVDSTGTVSTVLTDKRLSTSSLMTCSGTTLVMSGGPCLLSMSTAAASPSLSLIVGDCNTNATSITNGQSWTSTIPFISGLAAFGSSYVAYTAAVGLIIMDTSQSRVNTGPTITGTFSGIATAGSTTMVFTVGTCTIQVMQFTGSLPTVYAQVPTGATASVCTSYRWLAASAAGPGESENFVVLYGSQNGGALFQEAACGPASATTATTTAAPQSGGGGGGGGSDNTSTIVIAVVVSAAAVIIIVIIIVVVVVLKRAPAAQEQSSPQAAAQPAVEMQPMAQNTMAAPNSSVSDPTASHNNTPFNSLPRPAVNTAPNLSYPGFNSPGNTGGTVAASGSFLGQSADTYPPKAVEPATPGGSVSNQKRALTSSQMQGQGVVLAAVSHSDFANSGMEVTESDIRRHNKRCEYVAAGAYQKGKLLGRGANGSVYAVLLKDGSTIAMKEVYLVGSEEEIRVQMRDNEAEVQLLRELHHANLVTYYGVLIDQANLQLNIFMECVTGGSLGAMVRGMNERLSEDTARVFTHQIVQGLAFIHSHGIVHRDLKCDNILRDSHTGLIKLADFGTAKNVGNATNASRAAQTMIGTPYFMAPEILMAGMGEAQDAGYGIKADVWSLGITVAEMLNRGVPPWPAFPSPGHAFLHISSPQGIPIMPEGLSPECEDFIRRCTDRDPKTRISSSELLLHPWIAHVES